MLVAGPRPSPAITAKILAGLCLGLRGPGQASWEPPPPYLEGPASFSPLRSLCRAWFLILPGNLPRFQTNVQPAQVVHGLKR